MLCYFLFQCSEPSGNISEPVLKLCLIQRARRHRIPVAFNVFYLFGRFVEPDRVAMESDDYRRQYLPPLGTGVPPYERIHPLIVEICGVVEIPDDKVGHMVRHLRIISSLSPSPHASCTAVYQCRTRLCRMRLETGVISP